MGMVIWLPETSPQVGLLFSQMGPSTTAPMPPAPGFCQGQYQLLLISSLKTQAWAAILPKWNVFLGCMYLKVHLMSL